MSPAALFPPSFGLPQAPLKARFDKRDLTGPLRPPPVDLAVERYVKSVFGGPKSATIKAQGEDLDLWNLIELLRCPVAIEAPEGDAVWWGFVNEVQATLRNLYAPERPRIRVGVSLDGMANRVAVAYSTTSAAGQDTRGTTGWTDPDGNHYVSQGEYGIKELLWTASAASLAHAEAMRDQKLAELHYPQPVLELEYDAEESQATLHCLGWWSTLDWRYCAVPLQLALAYTTTGSLAQPFGDTDVDAMAQGITLHSEVNLAAVSVYVKKAGSPADNLEVSLYSVDANGKPGAELASGSVAGSGLTDSFAWVSVTLDSSYLASPGVYFLHVSRSGAGDAVNYYAVSLDERGGYAQGELRMLEDTAWNKYNYDLPFQLFADEPVETTQQIASLARNYGQFLRSVGISALSGITIESYRDGDSTALYEITQMLQMGTANNRRLLAEVDITRRLRVYEEPAIPANPYALYSDGSLADAGGQILRNCTCPVGVWARWTDVVPPSLNTSRIADPALVFVDENEYEAATDRLSPIPRGAVDPFNYSRIADG